MFYNVDKKERYCYICCRSSICCVTSVCEQTWLSTTSYCFVVLINPSIPPFIRTSSSVLCLILSPHQWRGCPAITVILDDWFYIIVQLFLSCFLTKWSFFLLLSLDLEGIFCLYNARSIFGVTLSNLCEKNSTFSCGRFRSLKENVQIQCKFEKHKIVWVKGWKKNKGIYIIFGTT